MKDPPTGPARDEYLTVSRWRQTERAQMIGVIHDMIEEAKTRAKSKRAPPSERIRWTRLAGQLIWYKDSILRNMTLEAMEKELILLKEEVQGKQNQEKKRAGEMSFGDTTSPTTIQKEHHRIITDSAVITQDKP